MTRFVLIALAIASTAASTPPPRMHCSAAAVGQRTAGSTSPKSSTPVRRSTASPGTRLTSGSNTAKGSAPIRSAASKDSALARCAP